MKEEFILNLSDPRATLERVGGKGASLARLSAAGLPVPDGFYVSTGAYRWFIVQNDLQEKILQDLEGVDLSVPSTLEETAQRIQERFLEAAIPEEVAEAITAAYGALPGTNPAVAVRSSATAEDLPEASFAGQQETYLNICGAQAVLEATRRCWASLWTGRAISYRARQGISPDQVALAVVVQLLVPAQAAGILFTANPLTGQREQVLINAAWGLGEAVVGGLVTPDTWVVEKATGRVLRGEIADKQVMTVRGNGGTHEQPVPDALRGAPVLDDPSLAELARLGVQIETLYGLPMDIEWALSRSEDATDGKVPSQPAFAILQARPITALPEAALPQGTVVDEWPMPDPKGIYMRGSIIDFMPNPLTPLFGSLIVPSVNQSLHELMLRLAGADLEIYENYLLLINGFPYISARYSARQWLKLIAYLIPKIVPLLRNSASLWRDDALPRYRTTVDRWRSREAALLSPAELLSGVGELMQAVTDHLTSMQVATLGTAAGSEGLFTAVYDKLVKREGDPPAPAYLLGFDSAPIRAEKSLFDLARWCAERPALADYLKQTPASSLAAGLSAALAPAGVDPGEWAEWQERFESHLEQYGYVLYDLDFYQPLPMDDPAPMLETIKLYLSGEGKDPYERQKAMAGRRVAAIQAVERRLKGLKAWAFRKSLRWAHSSLPMREDSIAEIGLGYPILRRLLLELGGRLVQSGSLANAEDIYWLEIQEVERAVTALEGGEALPDLAGLAAKRQAEWNARKRLTPPHQLPPGKKYLGMNADAFMGLHGGSQEGSAIHGLGASPGQVTAVARVLSGPQDFDEMRPGDVLVASITTPAWTPLFAMASAVVTDIGGPLSHGSIVAREYGIPAVLGTGVATHRIRSGQVVTVDGSAGVVTVREE